MYSYIKISKYHKNQKMIREQFVIPFILLTFLIITNVLLINNKDVGKEKMSIVDKIYYSFISFTTVGFGDFFPVSSKARMVSIIQNVAIIFIPLCVAYNNSSFQLVHQENMTKIMGNGVILLVAFMLHSGLYKENNIDILAKLYHTFVVHTTIGYGDISPSSVFGKVVNVLHPMSVFILSNF